MADTPPVGTEVVYMGAEECSGWVEIALDVFVTTKAIVLLATSSQGIYWFLKRNFIAIAVIIILLVSCTLVSTATATVIFVLTSGKVIHMKLLANKI